MIGLFFCGLSFKNLGGAWCPLVVQVWLFVSFQLSEGSLHCTWALPLVLNLIPVMIFREMTTKEGEEKGNHVTF